MNPEDQQLHDLEKDLASLTPAPPSQALADRVLSALAVQASVDGSSDEDLGDLSDLERELSRLHPVEPTAELSGRIMAALDTEMAGDEEGGKMLEFSPARPAPAPRSSRSRFPGKQLLAVAALLAIAALLVTKLLDDLWPPQAPSPAGGGYADSGPSAGTTPGGTAARAPGGTGPRAKGAMPVSDGYRPTRIENDVVDSWVEGIFRGADDQMYQKVVRKFMDTVEYQDSNGRTIRVQKPRFQTVYIPVDGPF